MGHHHRKVKEDPTLQTDDCVVLRARAADNDVARIRREIRTKVAGQAPPFPLPAPGGALAPPGRMPDFIMLGIK
eukprot:6947520-Heterocapsa_arctica.AAC.1